MKQEILKEIHERLKEIEKLMEKNPTSLVRFDMNYHLQKAIQSIADHIK